MRTFASTSLALAVFVGVTPLHAGFLPNPTITLSSTPFGATFAPTNVFDSKQNEYASQSLGFGPTLSTSQGTWMEFDFGSAVTMDRFIDVTRRNAVDVVNTERLIFSTDPVFTSSDPFVDFTPAGQNGNGFIKSFAPKTVRYVRWEVIDGALNAGVNNRNFGSTEMRFLSPSTGLTQLSPTVIGGAQEQTSLWLMPPMAIRVGRARLESSTPVLL